jgi:hypothetical protein
MLRDNSILLFFGFHVVKRVGFIIESFACVSVGMLQLHFPIFYRLITRKHSILVCCCSVPASSICYHKNWAVVLLVTRNGIVRRVMLIRFPDFCYQPHFILSLLELSSLIWILVSRIFANLRRA